MLMSGRLAVIVATVFALGCDGRSLSPLAATPVSLPTAVAKPSGDAVLSVGSLHATFNPQGWGSVKASFTLTETAGHSGAILESVLFEESGGQRDFIDAWCWGDDPIRIPPLATFDASTLGYCQPVILTASPGDSASLTVAYRYDDGRRATIRASTTVTR
jgi:hypothetical protein